MLPFEHFEVVTFDCYGTLIDWESGILEAVRPILARSGIEAGDDLLLESYARLESEAETGAYAPYARVLRRVMEGMGRRFGVEVGPEEIDCLPDSIAQWPPFPDTVKALGRLKTRYRLAVVSNIDDHLFARTAPRLEVPFDWVITAEQARAYKPSRRVFDLALRTIGVEARRILHVAQSLYHDVGPAQELGLATVWVNRRAGRPGSGATMPADARPDVEVEDLESLVRLAGL